MWMLSFIPAEWITLAIHGIFGIGVIGLVVGAVASKIPFISSYGHIVKSVAGLFFVAGLFLEGYNYASKDWIEQTKKFEEKVKIAEQKAKDVNVKLNQALIDKNNSIKQQQILIQEKIKEVQVKVNAECKISPEVVKILNDAAKVK